TVRHSGSFPGVTTTPDEPDRPSRCHRQRLDAQGDGIVAHARSSAMSITRLRQSRVKPLSGNFLPVKRTDSEQNKRYRLTREYPAASNVVACAGETLIVPAAIGLLPRASGRCPSKR